MPNSGDKRWKEKDDGINTLLRQQNEELIIKYLIPLVITLILITIATSRK
tara:strand:+ start:1875 stop:2024 length:150 start_codon:yes stop_codon:yes gene_type:complete